MAHVKQPVAPNLVVPTREYSEVTANQLHNQLRLYFNQLDNAHAQEANSVHSNNVLIWLGGL